MSGHPDGFLRDLPDSCGAELDESHTITLELLVIGLFVAPDEVCALAFSSEREGDQDGFC